jgi:hypothetical protein
VLVVALGAVGAFVGVRLFKPGTGARRN